MSGWLQAAFILMVLVALHIPLGDYMARVYTDSRHWRAEKVIYRLCGIDPQVDQRWIHYLTALLAFSGTGVLLLYVLLRLQAELPLSVGHAGLSPALAFNTAVSFTTNTSWQNYSGESALGHFALAAGLGVQAFASAAVGMAAGLALTRGLIRRRTDRIGNFWVDVIRSVTRILLPLSLLFAIVFVALGVIQNLEGIRTTVTTLTGSRQPILGGPVASWESIKLMSGDGGGFFGVSSAHPFENPTSVTNVIEIVLMLLIPTGFIRMFGRLVDDRRQGWTLLAVAGTLFLLALVGAAAAENAHHGTVPTAVGAATEGKETRFGVMGGATFGVAATASADGASNSGYDSFTSLGGGVLMAIMMLGEVSPGGCGSGLYGLLIISLVAVFLGGLMIGRTPEYLGKRIGSREIKLVVLYQLATPVAVLVGSALAIGSSNGRAAMGNTGAHGLSEVVYAFTSTANGNGSAFGGLNGDTAFFSTALAITMLIGRYLPIIFVIALAGSLAGQQRGTTTIGTLRSHGPAFALMTVGVALIVGGLTYLPALSLGPLADGLHHTLR
ncbi:potassium-transporting ATPase subunit KdpA [Streptosporangium sp. NPDC005286]|uniref:potassium-transporting ATPase subunit KdpA n=1 Tax=Streptosporangium sp. NPDC005286 TaxID=3154463 RepID=UPI0033A1F60D